MCTHLNTSLLCFFSKRFRAARTRKTEIIKVSSLRTSFKLPYIIHISLLKLELLSIYGRQFSALLPFFNFPATLNGVVIAVAEM